MSTSATHNAIMEAGGKDSAPMLIVGSYVQWNPESEDTLLQDQIMISLIIVLIMLIDTKAKAVHIILTGIDNDIYSIVESCDNAKEMWLAIKRLMQGKNTNKQDVETKLFWAFGKFTSHEGESLESYYFRFYKLMNELVRNKCEVSNHQVNVQFLLQLQPEWQRFMTIVKQGQDLKTVSYHKLMDILKQHQNELNEIRAKRFARNANPLALVAPTQQQPNYYPPPKPIIILHHQQHDHKLLPDAKKKRLQELILHLLKIYKPTNNNLRTSSNTRNKNVNNTLRTSGYARQTRQYENQRAINVAGNRDTLEVIPAADEGTGPVFDKEPLEHVHTNDEYNVFAMENEHLVQHESINDTYVMEQCDSNTTPDLSNMSNNGEEADQDEQKFQEERALIASLIEQMKLEIDECKRMNNV
ncbi:hypothetical protein Tco_0556861 [Tanacetum coccineum]